MRYWGFFAAKIIAIFGFLYGFRMAWLSVIPDVQGWVDFRQRFGQDLVWTVACLLYGLLGAGLVMLAILDQGYRCRCCARRVRMPVETGSWANSLQLGPPRLAYICPFGHGTLWVPEVQIAGRELPAWKPNQDMWRELENLDQR